MEITKKKFGVTHAGDEVTAYTLKNSSGAYVTLLDYGCTIQAICVPDRDGKLVDVCLGYHTIEEYEQNDSYLGAVIGRFGNRIEKGRFELNGKTYEVAVNNGPNHLHGGMKGFDKYIWDVLITDDSIQFSRLSPDMEEGYPGNLAVSVTYRFTEENELVLDYQAKSDADTVLNLTNHCYFNLSGEGSGTVLDHDLQLLSSHYMEGDADCLATGKVLDVAGTPFDFREAKKIGRDIGMDDVQLKYGGGYDHNFIIDSEAYLKKTAVLSSNATGIRMTVWTTQPGVQVYSGNVLTHRQGKTGVYDPHDALCLETQHFPNSVGKKEFPSVILKKGEEYSQLTVYHFER